MSTPLFDVAATEQPETPTRYTERDVLDWLRDKYTRVRIGTNADRYVRAEHARYPSSFGTATRIADYIVLDTYGGSRVLGFEVKVSRSDWLAELRDPTKADEWKRHCHAWYLVVPDTSIVRSDLPDDWGLMAPNAAGSLTIRHHSTLPDPQPMTVDVLASLGRSIAQTATREATR